MVSTYSNNFRFELIATGDQSGVWGITTNGTLGTLIEQALGGVGNIPHNDTASITLTTLNGAVDQARNAVLVITGVLTADRQVICPDIEKLYIIVNSTTGGFSITLKTAAGTGPTIANGRSALVYCDGTNVNDVSSNVTVNNANWSGTPLSVGNGGSGGATPQEARTAFELDTVSQPEAEAGTATTTRAWTAQRVRQAINAVTDTTNRRLASVTFIIDGGGQVIETGFKGYLEVPFAGTIQRVTTMSAISGSIVIDIWKDTYANFPPTDADSIVSGTPPTLSSSTNAQDSTLTGWTTAIAAGDIVGFNVDSAATVETVTVALEVLKT